MKDNPKETMEKYGQNPKFREVLDQFSQLMAGHFTGLASKKEEEVKEQMKDDPVYKTI